MQCLFCGKELALLKRWRGGAEFCSEAHRKEYQEQFEQLAVARLRQAKPPSEPAPPLGLPFAGPPAASEPIPQQHRGEEPAASRPDSQVPPSPPVRKIEVPASRVPQPARVAHRTEDVGPAPLAGFVNDAVVPAMSPFQIASTLHMERVTSPSLPGGAVMDSADAVAAGSEASLPTAPRVQFDLSLQALDHHTRICERGLDVREFAAPAPLMELHLRPATGSEPAGAADVMEILMSPHPPQKAAPWLGVPQGFPAAPAELGLLARLDFPTTGFAYSDGPASARAGQMPTAVQAAVLTAEAVAATETPKAPVTEAGPVAEAAPVTEAPPVEASPVVPAPPELVTTALPVTLHGLAAQRGKLVQTVSSALTAASDVQIPLSAALPLRPAIVFGPAPAPAAKPIQATPIQLKPAPEKPAQAKPVQEKQVQEKTESGFRSSMVPVPKGVPVKRPALPETAPESKAPKVSAPAAPVANPREETPKDSFTPKPLEAVAINAGLPSLRLETTESAWSKLSTGLKIGVAAALVVALSGIAYVVTRGGAKTASEPRPAAPAISSVDAGVPISGGWIDDWANAAKSKRHISVLSGSAKLSDYRMEFQSQIETKAIGWIFRGLNPRNYYVAKLETITPGLEPTVALVHFAVVDGQDENRVVVPLPMKVRVDTTYKVRFDAIGNRFTAWVQGEKIAEWTDSRFGSGGVGFFSERDEHAALQGTVNVMALVPKN